MSIEDDQISQYLLRKIESILPRLKYSVLPTKVIQWLNNFEETEIDLALDILRVYEYINFDEFLYRIEDLLNQLFKENVADGEKVIIMPYGKVGKSGTLVTYPLKNTRPYKRKEKKGEVILSHDYEKIENPSSYKHIIFIDDFIGSGRTFEKEYTSDIEKWITINNIPYIYLLSSIIMEEGREYILNRYPCIKIYSEGRNKIFHPKDSPFYLFGNFDKILELSLKHGNNINVKGPPAPYTLPRGYDESESLVSFFHGTPNNTLPIIWGDNKWFPLFPRKAEVRMNRARKFKQDIAFMIGICNKLKIDLYNNESIIIRKEGKSVREIKYNSKTHHSLVALLKLRTTGYDNPFICHILGLTMKELTDIYNKGKTLGFFDKYYKISVKGDLFLKELYEKTRNEKYRKESEENLEPENKLYLPKTFKGEGIIKG